MPERLSQDARTIALDTIPLWHYEPDKAAIAREFRFGDFVEAFGFMARVALLAEAQGHHPDWSNAYDRVVIALTTHSEGGVTESDIRLAAAIDRLVPGPG